MISNRMRPLILGAPLLLARAEAMVPALEIPRSVTQHATVPADEDNLMELVANNTAFALDLYQVLRQQADGNLLFSPYSVSVALAMTYAGASGETQAQMDETLGFTLDQPALHEAFGALNNDLTERGNANEDSESYLEGKELVKQARGLRIANGLWGERSYPFSEEFSTQIEQYYGAGLQEVDFLNAPEEARGNINEWISEQTEGHIESIVPEDAITADTRLVLANAIWFSGGWFAPFYPEATGDDDFFLFDGTSVSVPFMVQHVSLPYVRGDGVLLVELPYVGSELTLTVIFPNEGQFAAFEAGLDADALKGMIGQLVSTEVVLYMPRFAFAFNASIKASLQILGMSSAFDKNRADFTGMVDRPTPEPLRISDVLHKAFISVDEEGTEAAAATIVHVIPGAAAPGEDPPEIHLDRPFLFVIRDKITGTLLFLGRVMDPRP